MRNNIVFICIFVLVAGMAGCQLLRQPSLATRCAETYPCKDSTVIEIVNVRDTIIEPYIDTLFQFETHIDTVLGIPQTKIDTFYEVKKRNRYVTRTDTVTKYLRVDTARNAADKAEIDSLNAHLNRIKAQFKGAKTRGASTIWALLVAVFGLATWLFGRKTSKNG